MTTVSYPSDSFPAPSGVSIDCPDGWRPMPEAAQCLAVVKDAEPGQFRANVIVSVRRMAAGTALDSAIAELHDRIKQLSEYAPIGEERRLVDGCQGFRIEGSFVDATAGTIVQAIRLAVVPLGPVEDLVQTTGSCHGSQVPLALQQIRDIQDSLKVEKKSRQ